MNPSTCILFLCFGGKLKFHNAIKRLVDNYGIDIIEDFSVMPIYPRITFVFQDFIDRVFNKRLSVIQNAFCCQRCDYIFYENSDCVLFVNISNYGKLNRLANPSFFDCSQNDGCIFPRKAVFLIYVRAFCDFTFSSVLDMIKRFAFAIYRHA